MFYDEEQFFRGGEFDEEIEQLKETLKKSVRKEVLDESEKLRAENKELQGIKANFEKIKRDYEDKKRECDRVMFDAESKAKRARLSEIMEQHKLFLYSPGKRQAYKAKCDKCDRWRQVKVPLPSGSFLDTIRSIQKSSKSTRGGSASCCWHSRFSNILRFPECGQVSAASISSSCFRVSHSTSGFEKCVQTHNA